jgi:DNA-binding NtrC family response regulator
MASKDGRGRPPDIATQEISGDRLAEILALPKCRLVVTRGPDTGTDRVLDKAVIRIGADPESDLVLSDDTTSRHHCEIRQTKQGWRILDLGSTNGVIVAGTPAKDATLVPDCEIVLGNTAIRFTSEIESFPVLPADQTRYGELIGRSVRMREVYTVIERVAPSDLAVVIEGETGTGKELVARAIHARSRRSYKPYLVFDCSAFPPNLLESELFGHERGAFSGAIATHRGVFERADGGTVFFDELGEMAPEVQPKFLRVIETGEVRRVGGEKDFRVDTRIVAATNRSLAAMVEGGIFRQDLFFRLAKVQLQLPPLRSRPEDINLLVDHFLEEHAERVRGERRLTARFSRAAMDLLLTYAFPGNVRELKNIVERAATFCDEGVIGLGDLPSEVGGSGDMPGMVPFATGGPTPVSSAGRSFHDAKEEMLRSFEHEFLEDLLRRFGSNISRAAREASVDRRHFYRLLRKHGLHGSDRSEGESR